MSGAIFFKTASCGFSGRPMLLEMIRPGEPYERALRRLMKRVKKAGLLDTAERKHERS